MAGAMLTESRHHEPATDRARFSGAVPLPIAAGVVMLHREVLTFSAGTAIYVPLSLLAIARSVPIMPIKNQQARLCFEITPDRHQGTSSRTGQAKKATGPTA